jgi:hypothetical protein
MPNSAMSSNLIFPSRRPMNPDHSATWSTSLHQSRARFQGKKRKTISSVLAGRDYFAKVFRVFATTTRAMVAREQRDWQ